MLFTKIRSMKIIVRLTIAIVVILIFRGCIFSSKGLSGRVVDIDTGKPIEGAILVRTWLYYAFPFSHSGSFLTFDEVVSDKNGNYHFISKTRPFLSPSFLNSIYEMPLLVYKPGYYFSGFKQGQSSVSLKKVHDSYFSRREQIEKAKELNLYVDYKKTRQLNKEIQREEAFVNTLPKKINGIFYLGDRVHPIKDIKIESDGHGKPIFERQRSTSFGKNTIAIDRSSLSVFSTNGKSICNYSVPSDGLEFADKNRKVAFFSIPKEQINFSDVSVDKQGYIYIGYPVRKGFGGLLKLDSSCSPIYNKKSRFI